MLVQLDLYLYFVFVFSFVFGFDQIPANLVNHLINRAHVFAPLEVHLPMIELRLHLWGPRFDQGNTDGYFCIDLY